MSERELQDWIVATARLLGWRIFHARAARTAAGWRTAISYDGAGFPDLVLARERVIYSEIKLERGRLRPEQVVWLDVLREAGQEVYVWRPADWTSGEVENVLRSVRVEAAA
ncbi:MAG: VRR-NUC domain-containing protein [Actinomycetota bacterium]|nr:VRR-NUC domain-containing protein [Actinomycetota bacterium]